eukprot:CAMPEP_0198295792 /NCGR_PEP_ID=MMETSP1449-20131203/29602_1 /TAXON_ID=420275 /ORGANISM="Attheya septentrionalis, Strain CCMP2084" /LENGTH=476 /DNA_ID=CAMNT_0043996201 /DNA_START=203 /DNA_END=1633 /DNA_ORIENTATION=+
MSSTDDRGLRLLTRGKRQRRRTEERDFSRNSIFVALFGCYYCVLTAALSSAFSQHPAMSSPSIRMAHPLAWAVTGITRTTKSRWNCYQKGEYFSPVGRTKQSRALWCYSRMRESNSYLDSYRTPRNRYLLGRSFSIARQPPLFSKEKRSTSAIPNTSNLDILDQVPEIPTTGTSSVSSRETDSQNKAIGSNELPEGEGCDITLEQMFCFDLPEGKCVGLRLVFDEDSPDLEKNPHNWIRQLLHPKEITFGIDNYSIEHSRTSFYLGRLAMRAALKMPPSSMNVSACSKEEENSQMNECIVLPVVNREEHCILRDQYGRPGLPQGYLGSISHKKNTGVALVACDDERLISTDSNDTPIKGIGVDIEQTFSKNKNIGKRILTERELKELGNIEGVTRDEEVLLRFSLKESLYKAMHPLICQYVGFQEAEMTPRSDGSVDVAINLLGGQQKMFGHVSAHWRRLPKEQLFLTSASVTLKE